MSCRERNLSCERGEIGLALHNLLRPYRAYLAREEHKRTQRHASRCPTGDFLFRHLSEVEQETAAHDERETEYESDGDTDEEGFQCDREHVGSGHYEDPVEMELKVSSRTLCEYVEDVTRTRRSIRLDPSLVDRRVSIRSLRHYP